MMKAIRSSETSIVTSATSQKTAFFMVNAVKTANLACCSYKKQTLWPLVRKTTIPTEWPPFVDEI
jgi:hypothetical protein